jgi:protein-tyrosine phosphatase
VQGEHVTTETVLIVCSANQCRSPLAAALLRRALDGSDVAVLDAGTGENGYPVTDETLTTASRLGVDLSEHRSTSIDPALVDAADLILTMERLHVRTIVVEDQEAWSKTFTLKELIRRAEVVGPRPSRQSLSEWLMTLHEGRNRRDLLGASPVDDVADPTSDRRVDHGAMAEELDELVAATVALVWPDAASRADRGSG